MQRRKLTRGPFVATTAAALAAFQICTQAIGTKFTALALALAEGEVEGFLRT
jgi:hypothetical protein